MNKRPSHTVSRLHPLQHYIWGDQCDGWNFVDQPGLSVKMERMPPHTAEQLHFHRQARQFFYILKGTATFLFAWTEAPTESDSGPVAAERQIIVYKEQGLEIPPGQWHRILNEGDGDLEFLLCSQPSTAGDRTNV
ncbi:MAG TPA: cupin domain-containing protein [Puia sp.]|nr:cupin domain-containing protein [Puia sp.]